MVLRMVYSCFVVGSVDGWVRIISDYSKVHIDVLPTMLFHMALSFA